jgi:hypothetical protein
MNDQPHNSQTIPCGRTELFHSGYLNQHAALLLRVEAANWLWWLMRKKVARTTSKGSC